MVEAHGRKRLHLSSVLYSSLVIARVVGLYYRNLVLGWLLLSDFAAAFPWGDETPVNLVFVVVDERYRHG
jgi:hypothetical protein